jgi:uncharacterized NAD(P)/FAD-binding protein YdhS
MHRAQLKPLVRKTMNYSVAIVGAGPTAIYCVQALIQLDTPPASISVFERQRRAGQGTPYSPHWSDPLMLANVASIEMPPLPRRLIDWVVDLSDTQLERYGVVRADIDERTFFPRLILGDYFASQFVALVDRARHLGIDITVRTMTTVADVLLVEEGAELTVTTARSQPEKIKFDYAVLATGHQWPEEPEVRPGYFISPYPASALAKIASCAVGIRGTSLSAIDAAVVLASAHGAFLTSADGEIVYSPHPGTDAFTITMFSRKGLLPEADFYHPIPYQPLTICTAQAVQHLIECAPPGGLLDDAFDLFRRELIADDPQYAAAVGLADASLEEFYEAYFEQRTRTDPFEWARVNLDEAVKNLRESVTVAWRYAILRMHEVIELLAPHLNDDEYERFSCYFKTIFADDYATIPHESIRRLLALGECDKLRIVALNDKGRIDTTTVEQGAAVTIGADSMNFHAFIEATGQKVLGADDFPFPSLRRSGVIQDASDSEGNGVKRGIAIDGQFHPISAYYSSAKLFCLSLPFLLGQHPFAQGITSSAEMAGVVANAIGSAETRAGAHAGA